MASSAIGLLPSGFAASVVRAGLVVLSFPAVALLRRLPDFGPPLPADVVVVSLGTLLLLWFFFTVSGYFREAYQRRTFVTMRLLEAANDRVRSVASELKRLNDEKSTFLGIAAHDLRNPLGVILGYAEMLRDEEFSRKETAEMAGKVVTAAERVRDLVAGLIELSAAEAGRVSLERRPCDLLGIARRVVEAQTASAERKEIGIRVDGAAVIVTGDPGAIQQVVENVVSNAVKFSPWKSTVVVSVHPDGGTGVLEVEDEGPGVDENDRSAALREVRPTLRAADRRRVVDRPRPLHRQDADRGDGRRGLSREPSRPRRPFPGPAPRLSPPRPGRGCSILPPRELPRRQLSVLRRRGPLPRRLVGGHRLPSVPIRRLEERRAASSRSGPSPSSSRPRPRSASGRRESRRPRG